jgi:glycosyltransferase involved in cell wall biosynthesis
MDHRSVTWVVIAAYNEAAMIGRVVSGVLADGWKVAVVDDGSRDDTAANAAAAGAVVLRHVVNLGQGAALQTGIEFALARGAERIVTFDADGQHRVEDLPAMVAALDDADVALGSRHLGGVEGASSGRKIFLRAATAMSNKMSGVKLTDAHCGFRAMRASIAPKLRMRQERMAHASELLGLIGKSGARIVEVPVTIRYTDYSKQKGQSPLQAIRIMFDHAFRR